MNPLLLSALLLLVAAALLLFLVWREHQATRHVVQRLGGDINMPGTGLLRKLNLCGLGQRERNVDNETLQLLDRLGWRRSRQRALFFTAQLVTPLALLLLVLIMQWWRNEPSATPWLAPLFAVGIGYLLPKRILASAAKKRQTRLAIEISTLIPMLRMLFEVGMTVEQALRVLSREGQQILPELSWELRHALARVDAGLDLAGELKQVTRWVQVDEVTDCFAILEQLIHQGGGAMASLLALKELLDDRRMTTLQERVSKLSAKMSVVMILFLFPALMIVLAGPGLIAIFQALGGIR